MNRIDRCFRDLRAARGKALIPFITAGDPDLSTTRELAWAFGEAGADLLEPRVPFSDPVAGIIVPDLPPEEAQHLQAYCTTAQVHTIFLAAPTSTEARLRRIAEVSQGRSEERRVGKECRSRWS